MKNIAIYIRKSVKGDDNSISLEAQIEVIKNYFKEKCNFTVYKDDGFSGGNTNRPGFQKLMIDAATNKFNTVACYKLDRIARNTLDFLTTFNTLKDYGITLICVEDNYDPNTPAGRMMMTLLASLAEMERENIKQRVNDSMLNLARQGRWTGGVSPFGYEVVTIDNGKYLSLQDGDNIYYIFNEFVNGKGIGKLSKEFNCAKKTIARMLHNVTYLKSSPEANIYLNKVLNYEVVGEPNSNGYLPYGQFTFVNGKKRKNINGLKIASVSKHKAVIDLNTFVKVQENLKKFDGNYAPRISLKTFLAQIVQCECGTNMLIALGHKRKDGTRKLYFYCPNKCGNKFADIERLENDIFLILDDVNVLEKIQKANTTINKDYFKIKKPLLKEIEEKKKILDGLTNKLAIINNSRLTNILIDKMEILTIEIDDLQKRLDALEKEELSKSLSKKDLQLKEEHRQNFIKNFDKMTIKEKQDSIKNVLNKIIWTHNGILIH